MRRIFGGMISTGCGGIMIPKELSEAPVCVTVTMERDPELDAFHRCSNYARLTRIITYCLRFYRAVRARFSERKLEQLRTSTWVILSLESRLISRRALFWDSSKHTRSQRKLRTPTWVQVGDWRDLAQWNVWISSSTNRNSSSRRLGQGDLPYSHLIILSKGKFITKLILRYEYEPLLYTGCESVLSYIRRRYWPFASSTIRGVLRKYIRYNRAELRSINYKPIINIESTNSSTLFQYGCELHRAVSHQKADKITIKTYLCVFVCLAIKAVYLEVTRDLITESFSNYLNRFLACRGRCRKICSDNGTNFLGAWNELNRIREFLKENEKFICHYAIAEDEWRFIPLHESHFGGLWESAVKSATLSVIEEMRLMDEELCTVLTRIEACLNSRPLYPISSNLKDLDLLTSGYFLTGSPITYPDVTWLGFSCYRQFTSNFGKDSNAIICINFNGRTQYRRPLEWTQWSYWKRRTCHRCDGDWAA